MAEITVIPAKDRTDEVVRTAAYARVSGDSEDQLNSFAAQIRYYTELLSNSTDAVFVDMYADEGITGTSTVKREDFQRLMEDCRKGKIDRILTKSVSRFARNTKDCLEAVRELKTLGVSVYFEKEKIDTGELSSEVLLTLHSQFAQEESMSISKNVRIGLRKRMKDGSYVPSSVPFGYIRVNGKLVINENEARIVRKVFADYLKGEGEKEKYYVSETHPAIISRETFNSVQRLIEKKGAVRRGKPTSSYAFSKKIYCGKMRNALQKERSQQQHVLGVP